MLPLNGRCWMIISILSAIGPVSGGIATHVARVMMVMIRFRTGRTVAGSSITITMSVRIRLDIVVVDFWIAAARSGWRAHVVLAVAIRGDGLPISVHVLLRICALLARRRRIVLFGSIVALLAGIWLHILDRAPWRSAYRGVWHGPSIA